MKTVKRRLHHHPLTFPTELEFEARALPESNAEGEVQILRLKIATNRPPVNSQNTIAIHV